MVQFLQTILGNVLLNTASHNFMGKEQTERELQWLNHGPFLLNLENKYKIA